MTSGERLGHDGMDKLGDISSEARDFTDQARGDKGILFIWGEKNGFQPGI